MPNEDRWRHSEAICMQLFGAHRWEEGRCRRCDARREDGATDPAPSTSSALPPVSDFEIVLEWRDSYRLIVGDGADDMAILYMAMRLYWQGKIPGTTLADAH